jgi:hypothetical protein
VGDLQMSVRSVMVSRDVLYLMTEVGRAPSGCNDAFGSRHGHYLIWGSCVVSFYLTRGSCGVSFVSVISTRENTGDRTDLWRVGFGDVTFSGRIKKGSAQVRFLCLPNAGVMLAESEEAVCLTSFFSGFALPFGAATKCGGVPSLCSKAKRICTLYCILQGALKNKMSFLPSCIEDFKCSVLSAKTT